MHQNHNINFSFEVDDGGAKITYYELLYKKETDNDWQSKQIFSPAGSFAGEDDTSYLLSVKCTNIIGTSDMAEIQKAHTIRGMTIFSSEQPTLFVPKLKDSSDIAKIQSAGIIVNLNPPVFNTELDLTNVGLKIKVSKTYAYTQNDSLGEMTWSTSSYYAGSITNDNFTVSPEEMKQTPLEIGWSKMQAESNNQAEWYLTVKNTNTLIFGDKKSNPSAYFMLANSTNTREAYCTISSIKIY